MTNLVQHVRHDICPLPRTPGHSIATVLSLRRAIVISTAIFSIA